MIKRDFQGHQRLITAKDSHLDYVLGQGFFFPTKII